MPDEIRIALIGLDTSHASEFTRRMQAPDCPPENKVEGMRAVTCLRFSTPFQDEKGLDERQGQLESWGVRVTTAFDEAVADCDAIMLEINDPAYHREYFEKCAGLGKPIFVDKPLADTWENGRAMFELARRDNLRVMSCSSLRFAQALLQACEGVRDAELTTTYGPLGKASAGSSVVWYGVHAFEMLERAMGRGAQSVFARRDGRGVVAIVDYPEGRRGIVELTEGVYTYGGCLRSRERVNPFVVDVGRIYTEQLREVEKFFRGAESPAGFHDALEIMALLEATERSSASGKTESISKG